MNKEAFIQLVGRHFGFLQREYGFEVAEIQDTRIQFNSKELYAAVYIGRKSYEVGFELGRRGTDERAFSLHEILGASFERDHTYFASSQEQLEQALESIARLVKTYGTKFLSGGEIELLELEGYRQQNSLEAMERQYYSPIREKASEAWKNHNYEEVIRNLESIREVLTKLEEKQLDYAKRQVASR